jgi:hypothetical protein
MAIQPIDLQTLFTQADKVGKTQVAERDGAALHQAMQGTQLQRRLDEQIRSVNEAQNTGDDGTEKVKDREAQTQDGGKRKKNRKEGGNPDEEQEPKAIVFSDPRLGRNIDISL